MHAKGSLILGRLQYVEKTYPASWEQYTDELEPGTREAIRAGLLKSSWYPIEMLLSVGDVAERMFGSGDHEVIRKMAAYSARVNMPTVYKVFLRLGSPEFMVSRLPRIWSTLYDSGAMTGHVVGHSAIVELRDFGHPDRGLCQGMSGFMEECLRIIGMKHVIPRHPTCRCDGAELCRWEATWER